MPAPTVLILVADGFEEMEALVPADILRRAGAEVTLASFNDGIHVTGRSGLTVHADTTIAAAAAQAFDCVLVPGGPGVARLRKDPRVGEILKRQHGSGRWIAAICAAPVVLLDTGILEGRRYTAHFSVALELPDRLEDEKVVVDGRIITSRGAGTALDFSLAIAEALFSKHKATEVAQSICA